MDWTTSVGNEPQTINFITGATCDFGNELPVLEHKGVLVKFGDNNVVATLGTPFVMAVSDLNAQEQPSA